MRRAEFIAACPDEDSTATLCLIDLLRVWPWLPCWQSPTNWTNWVRGQVLVVRTRNLLELYCSNTLEGIVVSLYRDLDVGPPMLLHYNAGHNRIAYYVREAYASAALKLLQAGPASQCSHIALESPPSQPTLLALLETLENDSKRLGIKKSSESGDLKASEEFALSIIQEAKAVETDSSGALGTAKVSLAGASDSGGPVDDQIQKMQIAIGIIQMLQEMGRNDTPLETLLRWSQDRMARLKASSTAQQPAAVGAGSGSVLADDLRSRLHAWLKPPDAAGPSASLPMPSAPPSAASEESSIAASPGSGVQSPAAVTLASDAVADVGGGAIAAFPSPPTSPPGFEVGTSPRYSLPDPTRQSIAVGASSASSVGAGVGTLSQLQSKLEREREILDAVRSERDLLQRECTYLQSQLEAKSTALAALMSEKEDMTTQLASTADIRADVAHLQAELSAKENAIRELRGRLEARSRHQRGAGSGSAATGNYAPGPAAPASRSNSRSPAASSIASVTGVGGEDDDGDAVDDVMMIRRCRGDASALRLMDEKALLELQSMLSSSQSAIAQRLRDLRDDAENEKTCRICLSNPKNVILLPCGHVCACPDCAVALMSGRSGLPKCPICRTVVKEKKAAYV